jgi:hypothetical protein
MHKSVVRVAMVVIVVAAGVAAAVFLGKLDRDAANLTVLEQQLAARIDRLTDAIRGAGVAQQSYVAPGQANPQAFERMTSSVRDIYDGAAALKPLLRSQNAAAGAQALNAATSDLVAADSRARENLRLGQPAMAADVIFSDSRSTIEAMLGRVRGIRDAERDAYASRRAELSRQRSMTLGLTGLVGLTALLLLVPLPAGSPLQAGNGIATDAGASANDAIADASSTPQPQPQLAEVTGPSVEPAVTLAAAAELCTALSRLATTNGLPPLLAKASELLDAPGIILWMGAGEELFAVTAHGYRPEIIARLGPIARAADNATASAWRTGQATIVSGDAAGSGAVVVPMFGPDTCIGALAVELRNGREHDPATVALASMIAAQLSTLVAGWPAASSDPGLRAANG